jgi:hypothetical protein
VISLESQPSQFIYGKFAGDSHEYNLIAWTSDLDDYRKQLLDLVEVSYHFWGSQEPQGNRKAAGLFPNNTGILGNKENILMQVSPAVDERGNPVSSGGRVFNQYRFIFIEQASIAQFNNCKGLLLGNLLQETIPCFYESPSNDESWTKINSEIFHLGTQVTYREQEQVFLSQKILLTQALSVILNGKRLLITSDEASMHPVKFLDHLLCWLPVSYRRKLSIAIGSVDENECNWANLIVKTNGIPEGSLPPNLVWIDRSRGKFYPNQEDDIENKFVTNFIVIPIQEQWVQASTLVEYLDTLDDERFNPKYPSLSFILQYTVKSQYYEQQKASLVREFLPDIKDQVYSFLVNDIDGLEHTHVDRILSSLWQGCREDDSLSILILEKILKLQPSRFLEVVNSDSFVQYVPRLLRSDFLDCLNNSEYPDAIKGIKQASFKAVAQQDGFEAKLKLVSLCGQHKNVFTEEECFNLSLSTLTKETPFESFKALFREHIIYYLPNLEVTSFKESSLYSYLKTQSTNLANHLYSLLRLKNEGGLQNLSFITSDLGINDSGIEDFYMVFIKAWQPNFQQGLPIILSCLQKSIEDNLAFQISVFSKIYEYFEVLRNGLLLALNKVASQPNSWQSWQDIISVLDYSSNTSTIILFDKILGRCFCSEMLKLWLNLFTVSSSASDLEREFLDGNTWKALNSDAIRKAQLSLSSAYNQYIPKLSIWASQEKPDLINDVFLDSLEKIWIDQNSIDKEIWSILTDSSMLNYFDSKYWLKLFFIKLSIKSYLFLPLPKIALSDNEERLMYSHASKIVSQSNNSDDIDRTLQDCNGFGLRPLAILRYAPPEACSLSLITKYVIQADEKDDDYMPGCLMLLSQITTPSNNGEKDRVKQMISFGQQIINTIPQQNKKKSLEIVLESLLSFIDVSA